MSVHQKKDDRYSGLGFMFLFKNAIIVVEILFSYLEFSDFADTGKESVIDRFHFLVIISQ